MPYYLIELTPLEDPTFCLLRDYPEGVELDSYRFDEGEAFGDEYPADARVFMSRKEKGTRLGALVGNTCSMLILRRDVKEVLEADVDAPVEYLPLAIHDHKKRLASDDYFVVNPIGAFDCLDTEASDIEYLDDDVVGVDEMVLDPQKLEQAPDLFRVKEAPFEYVISEALLEKLRSSGIDLSNFHVERLPVAGE